MSTAAPSLPHRRWVPFVLLAGMWVLLALVTVPTWGWTYWDFGDGNYMYIARRVREGLVLYKDILAPQPPLHVLGGMAAESLGASLLNNELYGVRIYCLLLRMAASLGVMLVAWRLYDCAFRAVAAAGIYLLLPIGFWWTICYQSENIEVVFLVFALFFLSSWEKRPAMLAGVCSALACHCNMTGVPYLAVNALFVALRVPALLPWYLGTALGVYTVGALAANAWTEGFFVSNVLLNQVGTFPRTDILSAMNPGDTFLKYAFGKITREGYKVLEIEGPAILAAMVGMALRLAATPAVDRKAPLAERATWLRTEFLAWSAIGMMLSICFTAKGGTVNYIFMLGEPGVALFAAEAFVLLWRKFLPREGAEWRALSFWNTRVFLRLLGPVAVTLLAFAPLRENLRLTFSEAQAEIPANRALEIRGLIESYAQPGDTILAPPFYAYLTKTNVAAELAENYIWQIKWMNESFDQQMYGKATADGTAKMEELAESIREREPKVILLDMGQTAKVPAVYRAIQEQYVAAQEEPLRTRNTTLTVWIPKGTVPHHIPIN